MAQVATPAVSVVVGQLTAWPCGSDTLQVTVPAGVPDPDAAALTVAVKVKFDPAVGLEALSVTTVVEAKVLGLPLPTVTESVLDPLLEKTPSVAVNWALA